MPAAVARVSHIGRTVAARLALTVAACSAAGQAPKAGDWRRATKDFANTRCSDLDEVRADNGSQLRVAWTFSTGVMRGQEAAPLVVDGTMYVVGPYPNRLYALDLADGGALKWTYDPRPQSSSAGVACRDVVNRGAAYAGGTIYFNTLDAHTVAVGWWALPSRGSGAARSSVRC